MSIKYKTKLTKVKITDLKKQLFDLLAQSDVAMIEQDKKSYIFHAVKVTKYSDGYSVKIYHQPANGKEQYVELNNIFLIQLLINSILDGEIINVVD